MEAPQVTDASNRLSKNLGPLPEAAENPAVIVISGLPGTGKTYFSRRLAERLPCIILESDALRKQLFPTPTYTGAESAGLFQAIYQLADELLKKGVSIIVDATNLKEKHRETIYTIAENNKARLIQVQIEAPPEVVRKRLDARITRRRTDDYSDANWAVYQRMKPTAERIRRRHFTVNTARDITPVIDKIIKAAHNRRDTEHGD